jgi:hypothetical protein
LKIFFFSLSFVFAIAQSAFSQRNSFGLGTELLFPSGNSSNRSGFGAGLAASFELPVSSEFSISASAGFNGFVGRKYFGYRTPMIKAFPLKVGVKYYTGSDFYFEGQLGTALKSGTSYNSVLFSPGLGTYLKLNSIRQQLNVDLRYETWTMPSVQIGGNTLRSNFNFIALRAALVWGR